MIIVLFSLFIIPIVFAEDSVPDWRTLNHPEWGKVRVDWNKLPDYYDDKHPCGNDYNCYSVYYKAVPNSPFVDLDKKAMSIQVQGEVGLTYAHSIKNIQTQAEKEGGEGVVFNYFFGTSDKTARMYAAGDYASKKSENIAPRVREELRQRGVDISLDDVQEVVDDQMDHYAPGILETGAAYGYDAAKNVATALTVFFGAPVATGVSADVAAIAIPATRVTSEVAKGAELMFTAVEDVGNSNYGTAAIKVATIPIAFYSGRGVTAITTNLLEKGGEKLITEAAKEGFKPIIEEVAGASGRLIPRVATGPLLIEEMKQLMIAVTSKAIAHGGAVGTATEVSERIVGEVSKRGTKFALGVVTGSVLDIESKFKDNEQGLTESISTRIQAVEDCNPSKQQCISSDYKYNPLTGEETYTYYPTSECNVQSGKCTPLEMTYDSEGEVLSYSLNGEVLTYSPDGKTQVKQVPAKVPCSALDFNCRLREMVDSKGKDKQGAICG